MPTWLLGIGALIIMVIRRPLFGWLFGLFKREAGSLVRSYIEEPLERDAAAARAAQLKAGEHGPEPSDV